MVTVGSRKRQAPTSLGQDPDGRGCCGHEPDAIHQREPEGDVGNRRDSMTFEHIYETRAQNTPRGEHHGRPDQEMAVQDGQAIGVVKRQMSEGDLVWLDG